jgi:hypothetical protein
MHLQGSMLCNQEHCYARHTLILTPHHKTGSCKATPGQDPSGQERGVAVDMLSMCTNGCFIHSSCRRPAATLLLLLLVPLLHRLNFVMTTCNQCVISCRRRAKVYPKCDFACSWLDALCDDCCCCCMSLFAGSTLKVHSIYTCPIMHVCLNHAAVTVVVLPSLLSMPAGDTCTVNPRTTLPAVATAAADATAAALPSMLSILSCRPHFQGVPHVRLCLPLAGRSGGRHTRPAHPGVQGQGLPV